MSTHHIVSWRKPSPSVLFLSIIDSKTLQISQILRVPEERACALCNSDGEVSGVSWENSPERVRPYHPPQERLGKISIEG